MRAGPSRWPTCTRAAAVPARGSRGPRAGRSSRRRRTRTSPAASTAARSGPGLFVWRSTQRATLGRHGALAGDVASSRVPGDPHEAIGRLAVHRLELHRGERRAPDRPDRSPPSDDPEDRRQPAEHAAPQPRPPRCRRVLALHDRRRVVSAGGRPRLQLGRGPAAALRCGTRAMMSQRGIRACWAHAADRKDVRCGGSPAWPSSPSSLRLLRGSAGSTRRLWWVAGRRECRVLARPDRRAWWPVAGRGDRCRAPGRPAGEWRRHGRVGVHRIRPLCRAGRRRTAARLGGPPRSGLCRVTMSGRVPRCHPSTFGSGMPRRRFRTGRGARLPVGSAARLGALTPAVCRAPASPAALATSRSGSSAVPTAGRGRPPSRGPCGP